MFFGLFGKKRKEKKEIERLFEEGKIMIITDPRDYVDFYEFVEKTKHLKNIQKELFGDVPEGEI